MTSEPWVNLAQIRRTQGRRGEVFADILTDFPEKFSERKNVWLISEAAGAEPRPAELAAHWLHKGGIVLHFAGVESISDAETLKGLLVAIPRSERVALGEDEAYISDLMGCTLVDVAGGAPVAVGVIADVDRTAGPAPLLVVRRAGQGDSEVLVPFAKAYLSKIDLEAKRVEMALPAGLVDLNDAV